MWSTIQVLPLTSIKGWIMVKLLPKVLPIIMFLNIPYLFQFNITMLAGEKRTCLTSGKAATLTKKVLNQVSVVTFRCSSDQVDRSSKRNCNIWEYPSLVCPWGFFIDWPLNGYIKFTSIRNAFNICKNMYAFEICGPPCFLTIFRYFASGKPNYLNFTQEGSLNFCQSNLVIAFCILT